ncbi:MAG: RNA polymerase factor sigma-54 [Verrucomicrobia bacterium]|nr:RNA polymerase factor sigma-54 [Verrucomicrobiota bacterium]
MQIRLEHLQSQVQKPIITIMMSPQMQQAIQLLQLPILELSQKIEQELAENPVLEEIAREDSSEEAAAGEAGAEERATEERAAEQKAEEAREGEKDLQFKEEFDVLQKIDEEWRDYFRESGPYFRPSEDDEERRAFLENSITRSETLSEHLSAQMALAASSEEERELGDLVIGNIDEYGFLRISLDELALLAGRTPQEIEHVLKIIQTFDPSGVGARDLRESLLIQLRAMGKEGGLACRMIERHYEALGKKRYQDIARAERVKVTDVQEAVHDIMRLSLRPGSGFGQTQAQYITPDITLRKDDGKFEITINDERIPHLRISNFYRQMLGNDQVAKDVRDYIKDKVHAGRWLIKNIHQRQETLHNIASEIVRVQESFLKTGGGALKPLTMHQIAEAVGLHESTVSRAISGKYIDTPHGIFPLKFFFTTGIEMADGEEVSAHRVKRALREIVAKEETKRPLSDEALVKMLNDEGYRIARRTVAKYRKELGILPSHLRRSF